MRLRRTLAGALVLALLTVVTVRLVGRGEPETPTAARSSSTSSPTARATTPAATVAPGNDDGEPSAQATSGEPAGVPQNGTGKIRVVAVPAVDNEAAGRTVRYTVEIEGGLDVEEADVARTVQSVLLDPRGWQKVDGIRFVNVTPAQAAAGARVDIRVTLASPGLTDKLCAPMRTLSQVSCWNGQRSVLNFRRWALGDDSYGSDVARYRVYQVNHEVGHGLGHQHRSCPARGERAPVMVQQTLSLGGCKPWPYPTGA